MGDYVNDDGVTLNMTLRNKYDISYTHTPDTNATVAPATLTVTITPSGLKQLINENDKIGSIQIYDATHLVMKDATYKVTVTTSGGDVEMGTTVFQLWDDRTAWTVPTGKNVLLFDVTKITFAKQ